MQGEEETTRPLVDVMENGGRRVFIAERLSSGNWLLVEKSGATRRTINNEEFMKNYQKVPHYGDA